MIVQVPRLNDDGITTIGRLIVGVHSIGYTLEDTYRTEKVDGKTRIPAGRYKIIPRHTGRFFKAYSADTERNRARFGRPHPFALEIENVPGFTHILIHTGNDHTHTAGCILVGSSVDDENTKIYGSGETYGKFFDFVEDAVAAGNCWIEITDEADVG